MNKNCLHTSAKQLHELCSLIGKLWQCSLFTAKNILFSLKKKKKKKKRGD